MKPTYQEPKSRKTEARTRLGLASLLWMFVGAVITVMAGLFLYLSPLFDGFRKEVDVNPEVVVEPTQPQKPKEYEFYEILPESNFQGRGSALGSVPDDAEQAPQNPPPAKTPSTPTVDVVVSARPDGDKITIAQSDETYDDPASSDEKIDKIQISTSPSNTTYILQVRSYDSVEEADKKRNEVIVAGVDARVVHRIDTSGVALYQVISAPFTNKESAQEAQQRLSDSGIDALLIEQRR